MEKVIGKEMYNNYNRLCTLEKEMEDRMIRRRRELAAWPQLEQTRRQQLSITVYHAYDPPTNDEEGSWYLHIGGHVEKPPTCLMKFSSFFRKITILLDRTIYPQQNDITWSGLRSEGESDEFQIKRKGTIPHTVTIQLVRTYTPERYKVAEPLAVYVRLYIFLFNQLMLFLKLYCTVFGVNRRGYQAGYYYGAMGIHQTK